MAKVINKYGLTISTCIGKDSKNNEIRKTQKFDNVKHDATADKYEAVGQALLKLQISEAGTVQKIGKEERGMLEQDLPLI